MPDELAWQWERAPDYFGALGWSVLDAGDLEADDLLGSLAQAEVAAGGSALLFTGDRDMFQCVSRDVAVLFPKSGSKGGPELIDVAGVQERYGIEPEQVPDFIALRGDPSDGIPGAKGIGEKTARDLLRDHPTLDELIAAAAKPSTDLRPRIRASLTDGAQALRDYREMATLQHVDIERPPDAPPGAGAGRRTGPPRPRGEGPPAACRQGAPARRADRLDRRRGRRARARDEPAGRAPRRPRRLKGRANAPMRELLGR